LFVLVSGYTCAGLSSVYRAYSAFESTLNSLSYVSYRIGQSDYRTFGLSSRHRLIHHGL